MLKLLDWDNFNNFRYGIRDELLAKCLKTKIGRNILKCGLFIDKYLPYLAASPDGLIGTDWIVEIKFPASIKDYSPEEAFENKKTQIYGPQRWNFTIKN